MWEIELLDDDSNLLGLSFCNAMMALKHPTTKKCTLFHSINNHFQEKCHVLTVLKSAEFYMQAIIPPLLPHLQWKFSKPFGKQATAILAKWFKLTAHTTASDA